MSYDPSYWIRKELYIDDVRRIIDEMEDCCEGWKLFLYEIADYYEDYLDVLRTYKECYDPKEKKNLKKKLRHLKREFIKGVDMAYELSEEK